MRMFKLGRSAGFALAFLALLSGCSDDGAQSSGNPDAGGSCTFTVKFQGRTYTAAGGAGADAEKGLRKLGKAMPTACSDDTDSSGVDQLTIYTVVGKSPAEAVFAVPDIGLMVFTPSKEDE